MNWEENQIEKGSKIGLICRDQREFMNACPNSDANFNADFKKSKEGKNMIWSFKNSLFI